MNTKFFKGMYIQAIVKLIKFRNTSMVVKNSVTPFVCDYIFNLWTPNVNYS